MTHSYTSPSQHREGTTLAARTNFKYDPKQGSDHTPFTIGVYTVRRSPLPGSLLTKYRIYLDGKFIGTQNSYPTEADCRVHAHRQGTVFISKASKTKTQRIAVTPKSRPVASNQHPRIADLILKAIAHRALDVTEIYTALGQPTLAMTTLSSTLSTLVNKQLITRTGKVRRYRYQTA